MARQYQQIAITLPAEMADDMNHDSMLLGINRSEFVRGLYMAYVQSNKDKQKKAKKVKNS